MSMTEIEIPKEPTFKLPEGSFRAVIQSYITEPVETTRGPGRNAKILFEVFVPRMKRYECLARRVVSHDLRKGSEMRRFLAGLLTENYFVERASQTVDLKQELVGRECEVELIHAAFDSDRYSHPLVVVKSIRPYEKPSDEPEPPPVLNAHLAKRVTKP